MTGDSVQAMDQQFNLSPDDFRSRCGENRSLTVALGITLILRSRMGRPAVF
jgi:hypothetical protein